MIPRVSRKRKRAYRRFAFAFALFLFLFDVCVQIWSRLPPAAPMPTPNLAQSLLPSQRHNTTVFIASVHRNTQEILDAAWNSAVLDLVHHLGPENVYFSAIESGSQDKTKESLKRLKERLDEAGVANTVKLGTTVWEQLKELGDRPPPGQRKKGWIWNQHDNQFDLRRIPYLARVRNEAMEPLGALAKEGRQFDKVLWINDVVFRVEDFTNLLNTRNGQYAAACSMDFKEYPFYYDTFALRDDQGQKTASHYWPWFASDRARSAARRGLPVKVMSCWNGMVLFDATPFYADPPLLFRGIDDSLADFHLEASECCLIHADNAMSADPAKGVWLNPNVRVGYNLEAYQNVNSGPFPRPLTAIVGTWANRWMRLRAAVQFRLEGLTVSRRLARWKAEAPPDEQTNRVEPGASCLINEMQIMYQNGWRHL